MKRIIISGLLMGCMLIGSFAFAQDASSGATAARSYKKEAPANKQGKEFDEMIRNMWYNVPVQQWDARKADLDQIVLAADKVTPREYKNYFNADNKDSLNYYLGYDIFRYNDAAFSKVLKEVKESAVPAGEVHMWHVYNMGYIVKTAKVCFAMDLKHRRACELIPYLDFATISHKHGDHYSDNFNAEMEAAGKPVLSNFLKNRYFVENPTETVIQGVKIRANYADHNKDLLNFVVVYEFELGKDVNKFTLFHSGDACNFEQFHPTRKADVFIYHMRVGLNLEKAHAEVLPNTSLLSHVMELGHPKGKARWTYDDALKKRNEISMKNVLVPIWGEKIVFKTR